ncbi:class I SAM-dependent methyltransferase [Solimicrobium silvestre]|uniref:Methyltransferase domain n=1 Tax=Solimicrobium silvestre TaxID=2099400 RepID=A0A2S9H265_9BURK|nr:class I SAM-dependent methyltransferase [Solimicrobium silvestre]PRC94047.1 Methyltransferase domain [Solimicrobium silvestre]
MRQMIGYLQVMRLMLFTSNLFSTLFELTWYKTMLESWLAPLITPDAKILEVGCAGGDLSRWLADKQMQVWAVDSSAASLGKAMHISGQVHFAQADAHHLPFPDGYFDFVVAASLINVVDAPDAVIGEMHRVCRDGGTVAVLVPDQLFTVAEAEKFLETERLTGFSRAAYSTWNRLARKMHADDVYRYFNECGLVNISSNRLLDGLVFAMYGNKLININS